MPFWKISENIPQPEKSVDSLFLKAMDGMTQAGYESHHRQTLQLKKQRANNDTEQYFTSLLNNSWFLANETILLQEMLVNFAASKTRINEQMVMNRASDINDQVRGHTVEYAQRLRPQFQQINPMSARIEAIEFEFKYHAAGNAVIKAFISAACRDPEFISMLQNCDSVRLKEAMKNHLELWTNKLIGNLSFSKIIK